MNKCPAATNGKQHAKRYSLCCWEQKESSSKKESDNKKKQRFNKRHKVCSNLSNKLSIYSSIKFEEEFLPILASIFHMHVIMVGLLPENATRHAENALIGVISCSHFCLFVCL